MKGVFVFISILLISILAAQLWHNQTPNHGKIDVEDALEQLVKSPKAWSKLAELELMVDAVKPYYEDSPESSGGPLYYESGDSLIEFKTILQIEAPQGAIFQGNWRGAQPKILIIQIETGECGKYFIEQDSIVKIDCPE